MLKRLHVKNYVLIDSLEIEFPAGLVIITGQTGAGKSILLGALSLLLGAKADASIIGVSSDNCVVEAEFGNIDNPELAAVLAENDADADGGTLVIRRVVNPSGRSRSFVNDSPVPVQLLSEISSFLVDIHSQHQTALLTDRHFQLSMLDHFAGNGRILEDYVDIYRKHAAAAAELSSLEERIGQARRDSEYNRARWERLDKASLKSGELEELESEQKRLANAEEIKESLCAAEQFLSSVSFAGEEHSVSSLIKDACRCVDRISGCMPSLAPLSGRLESCRIELEDIVSELSEMNSRTEISQERLEAVEERMSLLYSLMQSYSCQSVEELMEVRDSLASSLSDLSEGEERLAALRQEKDRLYGLLKERAAELSLSRKKAAPSFSASIRDSVRGLELPDAEFSADILPAEPGISGADTILFRFSADGKRLEDVAKCASGGERSRLMLAMKALMAKFTEMPTMIFDEIDTGVSGSVADKMGSMICEMGKDMQVFAITHLPQVAAKGDAHYLVSKENSSGRTISSIKRLDSAGRIQEVARMLSGSVLTDAAIANAKSLLGVN